MSIDIDNLWLINVDKIIYNFDQLLVINHNIKKSAYWFLYHRIPFFGFILFHVSSLLNRKKLFSLKNVNKIFRGSV